MRGGNGAESVLLKEFNTVGEMTGTVAKFSVVRFEACTWRTYSVWFHSVLIFAMISVSLEVPTPEQLNRMEPLAREVKKPFAFSRSQ